MGANMRVLVLDDDPRLPQLLRALRSLGVDAIGAATRAEAIAIFDQGIAGAILDLRLQPNDLYGGLVVGEYIRARSAHVPVILHTGNGDADVLAACKRLGIMYIEKPAVVAELVAILYSFRPPSKCGRSGVHVRTLPPTHEAILEQNEAATFSLGVLLERSDEDDAIVLTADGWRLRYHLTHMETAVLVEAARGSSRATIASRLGLTPETVKTHARKLITKTGDRDLGSAGLRLLHELVNGLATPMRRM